MRKGVFFTMDAVIALYLALVLMSVMMAMAESGKNYSEDSLSLARLSGDLYEVRKYDSTLKPPDFIATGILCDGKELVGSALVLGYGDIERVNWPVKADISTEYEKVCING